ncbi:MAG: hypothetical protein D6768_12605 [Chloroflexi bacterium]|nr:MAG: hypothetical protein D6768_12605 [Chloroflexota bacterium]
MADSISPPSFDWTLLLKWTLACTLGWLIGWALLGEIWIGPVLGLAQWLALRELSPRSSWWIVATTVGWLAGWWLLVSGVLVSPGSGFISSLFGGVVAGTLVGVAQWLLLRRWLPSAVVWVTANALGWALGFAGLLGGVLTGAVIGAVTGVALEWLVRNAATLDLLDSINNESGG